MRLNRPWPLRWAAVALPLLILLGCTTATPYMPATDGEGYSEQKLQDDRYRVSFAGNRLTSRQTVENYVLYRAAEITRETGHDWFRIASQDTDAETTYWSGGPAYPGPPFYDPYYPYRGRPFGYPYYDRTSRPVTTYQASAVVSLYKGVRPKDDDRAYDADEVIKALGPAIVWPKADD